MLAVSDGQRQFRIMLPGILLRFLSAWSISRLSRDVLVEALRRVGLAKTAGIGSESRGRPRLTVPLFSIHPRPCKKIRDSSRVFESALPGDYRTWYQNTWFDTAKSLRFGPDFSITCRHPANSPLIHRPTHPLASWVPLFVRSPVGVPNGQGEAFGTACSPIRAIPGHTLKEVGYHLTLLIEAGYVEGMVGFEECP
jgi:hypothetical protein